jgi:hypothetical protein
MAVGGIAAAAEVGVMDGAHALKTMTSNEMSIVVFIVVIPR